MIVAPDLAATGCNDDKSCSGDTPKCDVKTGKCVGCLGNEGCPGGQLCASGKCAPGCSVGHTDCADAGVCDVDAGVCRSCAKDDDCADPLLPACEVATMRCVACRPGGKGCAVGKYCDKKGDAWTCLDGCGKDADCPAGDGGASSLCCNHACVDGAADAKNCGACGKACDGAKACCTATCVDITADPAHCGMCGKSCQVANATPGCTAGKCVISKCAEGFGDCDSNTDNGCEADTN